MNQAQKLIQKQIDYIVKKGVEQYSSCNTDVETFIDSYSHNVIVEIQKVFKPENMDAAIFYIVNIAIDRLREEITNGTA